MDASRFDLLSRMLASSPTRRMALSTLAVLLGHKVLSPDQTVAQLRICRPLGSRCFAERGLDCCHGDCRQGRCQCSAGQRRCGTRCLPKRTRCRRRSRPRPRTGCPAGKQRCQDRCIAKNACCGGCPGGQVCRHGGCCNVTTTAELQAAIAEGGPNTIQLCPKTTYQGTFTIARTMTVIGAGAGSSVLDGAGSGPVVTIADAVTDPVELRELDIVNGVAPERGGGVMALGPLTLTRCRVANNEAATFGGGITSEAALTLVDTVVAGNRATGHLGGGGGIDARGSAANVTLHGNSRVEDNRATADECRGGGIYSGSGAVVTLRDQSQVRRNEAAEGGGAYLFAFSTASLRDDSHIQANTARTQGGGVHVHSNARLELHDRSVIKRNQSLIVAARGGGIFAHPGSTVVLPDQAMVSGNTPDQCEPHVDTATGTCE